jgi:hypothetical protein
MLMTFGYLPYPPLLLKLRQIDRIAARPTDAAVQGIFDHERAERLMFVASEHIDEERVRLRMLTAGAAAAKATRSQCSPFACPAVQPVTLPASLTLLASPSPARRRHNAPFGRGIRLFFHGSP